MFVEFVPPHIVARHTEELEAEMMGRSLKERHQDELSDKIVIEGEYRKRIEVVTLPQLLTRMKKDRREPVFCWL